MQHGYAVGNLYDYKLPELEDTAEPLGTMFKGRYAEVPSDVGGSSFNEIKVKSTVGSDIIDCRNSEHPKPAKSLIKMGVDKCIGYLIFV